MTISFPNAEKLTETIQSNHFLNSERFQQIGFYKELTKLATTTLANQNFNLNSFTVEFGNQINSLTEKFISCMTNIERSQVTTIALRHFENCAQLCE